jgi:hypothetical protein
VEPIMLAEDVRYSPTSSWWALGTLVTRTRLGCGRSISGERSGGYGRPIGEEIGYRSRHYVCFFNTVWSDGIELRKEGGAGGSLKERGAQVSAVLEVTSIDRVRCRGDVRELPPPPHVFRNSPTLQVQVGSREALPHKKRTAVSWPR